MPALALKYRPQSFDDLVGQLHAAQSLKNAIVYQQLGHAYLFYGSRGVGKTSTARILAKSLNCQKNGPSINPCGQCDNCRDIAAGKATDVIEMDAATNRGIENIRQLRENVRFAPMQSRYKIYIIDEVHMLSNDAFNALLKTLEEPPAHVIFILATTEQHKIPETILSRCQSYAFRKFSLEEIQNRLLFILQEEKIPFEAEALLPVVQKAEGSMRDALSLLDQVLAYAGQETLTLAGVQKVLGIVPVALYSDFLESIRRRDLRNNLLMIERLSNEGYNLKRFLWDFLEFLKNALLFKEKLSDQVILLFPAADRGLLQNSLSGWDSAELVQVFDNFYRLYSNWSLFQTSKSAEVRISLEIALVDLFHRLNQPSVSALLQKINNLKRAIESGETFSDVTIEKEPPAPAVAAAPAMAAVAPSPAVAVANQVSQIDPGSEPEAEDDLDTIIQREFLASEDNEQPPGLFGE